MLEHYEINWKNKSFISLGLLQLTILNDDNDDDGDDDGDNAGDTGYAADDDVDDANTTTVTLHAGH